MKNESKIQKLISDTTRHDANMIFTKLIDLDDINRSKFDTMKNLTTTELITNVDLNTLQEIATELQLPVNLPNRAIKGSHVFIDYKWGSVVLLANVTEN